MNNLSKKSLKKENKRLESERRKLINISTNANVIKRLYKELAELKILSIRIEAIEN